MSSGRFGTFLFGLTEWVKKLIPSNLKVVAVVGDTSTHGGFIISSGQDGTLFVGGQEVAVNGALHYCPQSGHGTTSITSVIMKTYHNGKLIVTDGAIAGCGAIIKPVYRGVFAG